MKQVRPRSPARSCDPSGPATPPDIGADTGAGTGTGAGAGVQDYCDQVTAYVEAVDAYLADPDAVDPGSLSAQGAALATASPELAADASANDRSALLDLCPTGVRCRVGPPRRIGRLTPRPCRMACRRRARARRRNGRVAPTAL